MRSTDAATFRLEGPRSSRAPIFRALAQALIPARGVAGVVIEHEAGVPAAGVVVRPVDLARGVAPAAGLGVPTPSRPAPRPPPGWSERYGVVLPLPEVVPWRADPTLGSGGPGGPGPWWLAAQTLWVRGPSGTLWAARRFCYAEPRARDGPSGFATVARTLAMDWAMSIDRPATTAEERIGAERAWRRRALAGLPRSAWTALDPVAIVRTAEPAGAAFPTAEPDRGGPTVVFGASGAGKTTYLAHRSAVAIAAGERVLAIDVHGDLAPAIVARLRPGDRHRVVAVDAGERPVAGIAALGGPADDDRAAAMFVAAVKRLSPDGAELYWGFRLERTFDAFVRLVREAGGSLLDLYDLLTNEARREATRLATRRPELARFLEELAPVVRRNPEFLWSAATRLSKVVLVPELADLLAPRDGGLPVEELIAAGRSVLIRLPVARLGPEASAFAGTLLLARLFLGLAARAEVARPPATVLVVLDEVHGFSAPLVAELLADGRKFGLRPVLATQYPDRLAPELRSAAAGVAARFVVFRLPAPAAREVGAWLGIDRDGAPELLGRLAPGYGVASSAETPALVPVEPAPVVAADDREAWADRVAATRPERGGETSGGPDDAATERLLLAVLGAEESGAALAESEVPEAVERTPGADLDRAVLADRWAEVRRQGWVAVREGRVRLSPAGECRIGLVPVTGAVRESAEHRRLLLATFRLFARRGYRLEIVRQGRFDTTLPDAQFRQLPLDPFRAGPAELALAVDRLRGGWAWRYFGGRDVHVEAEVSGAVRPERIRRGWQKARSRGRVVLFVVGEPSHARAVRRTLGRVGVPRGSAIVWTLRFPTVGPER